MKCKIMLYRVSVINSLYPSIDLLCKWFKGTIDFSCELSYVLNQTNDITIKYLSRTIKNIILSEKIKINKSILIQKDELFNTSKNLTELVEKRGGEEVLKEQCGMTTHDIVKWNKKYKEQLRVIFFCLQSNPGVLQKIYKDWIDVAIDYSTIPGSKEMIDSVFSDCRMKQDRVEMLGLLLNRFYLELKSLQYLCGEVFKDKKEQGKKEQDKLEIFKSDLEEHHVSRGIMASVQKEEEVFWDEHKDKIQEELRECMAKKRTIIRDQKERLRRNFLLSMREFRTVNLKDSREVQGVLKNLLAMFDKIDRDCKENVVDMIEGIKAILLSSCSLKQVSEEEFNNKTFKEQLCIRIVEFMEYFKKNRIILDRVYPDLGAILDRTEYLCGGEKDAAMQILCGRETEIFCIEQDMIVCYVLATKHEEYTFQSIFRSLMSALQNKLYVKQDSILVVSTSLLDEEPLAFRKYENMLKGKYAKMLDKDAVFVLGGIQESFYEV